jgi:hypothetical protein
MVERLKGRKAIHMKSEDASDLTEIEQIEQMGLAIHNALLALADAANAIEHAMATLALAQGE